MPSPSTSDRRGLFTSNPVRVCTIAGSDSGGGAGIQADLKTIQALGGYGLSVLTALTAQNTKGVQGIFHVPPEFVSQQVKSVLDDISIDGFKIGMLANREVAQVVAESLRSRPATHGNEPPVVLDPVMVSTSGSMLLKPDAIDVLLSDILPQCSLVTPNLPEASAILYYYGQSVPQGLPKLSLPGFTTRPLDAGEYPDTAPVFESIAMQQTAQIIASKSGAQAVLLKGGHSSFAQSEVQGLLGQLGAKPLAQPVRAFGLSRAPSSGSDAELLSDIEDVVSAIYTRSAVQGEAEVSVIRTDLRPWSSILIPQRSQPADGLNVAPNVDGGLVVADVLCEAVPDEPGRYRFTIIIKPHVPTTATHGTGCTLSSAIATHLAAGYTLRRAVLLGIEYVQGALLHGLDQVGQGPHPLNHSHALVPRAVPRRRSGRLPLGPNTSEKEAKAAELVHLAYLQPLTSQLIGSGVEEWYGFVNHPFVLALGRGTLPLSAFKHFLTQDFLFLRHYANIWASAAGKADEFDLIKNFASQALGMVQESELHVKLCAEWGISRRQLERETAESRATLAYTRFVLDVGRRYATAEVLVATLPCLLGYAEAGRNLALAHPKAKDEGNPFAEWIKTYADPEFQQSALDAVDTLERLVEEQTIAPSRLRTLKDIYHSAVKLEQGMWDEAIAVGRGEVIL